MTPREKASDILAGAYQLGAFESKIVCALAVEGITPEALDEIAEAAIAANRRSRGVEFDDQRARHKSAMKASAARQAAKRLRKKNTIVAVINACNICALPAPLGVDIGDDNKSATLTLSLRGTLNWAGVTRLKELLGAQEVVLDFAKEGTQSGVPWFHIHLYMSPRA